MTRTLLAAALLIVTGLTGSPAWASSSLDEAFATELRTLASERAALIGAHEAAAKRRAERSALIRKELAALNAAMLVASAQQEALTQRLALLERVGATPAGIDTVRLAERIEQLERATQISKQESGFFDREGAFVNGTVLQLGAAAAVGVFANGAGPLAYVDEGGRQLAVDSGPAADAARAALAGAGQLPLFFGRAPQDDPRDDAGLLAAMTRGGPFGAAVLLVALATVLLTLWRVLGLARATRHAQRLITQAPKRVQARDLHGAFGLCRAAPGPAGALFAAVIAELSNDPTSADERASAQLLSAQDALERGRAMSFAGITATLVGAALAVVLAIEHTLVAFANDGGASSREVMDAIAAALSPASIALGAALVAVMLSLLAAALASRLRVELERGVIELLDATRTLESSSLAAPPGVTLLPPLSPPHEARA